MIKKCIYIIVVIFTICACDSDNALLVISQEEGIDQYISQNFPENEVVRNEGSNRVVLSNGYDGLQVASGDSITILFEAYLFNGNPTSMFARDSVEILVDRSEMVQGLYNGLLGADLYEQSLILFSAEYGYYDNQVGLVPSMSALLYNVMITDIKKK